MTTAPSYLVLTPKPGEDIAPAFVMRAGGAWLTRPLDSAFPLPADIIAAHKEEAALKFPTASERLEVRPWLDPMPKVTIRARWFGDREEIVAGYSGIGAAKNGAASLSMKLDDQHHGAPRPQLLLMRKGSEPEAPLLWWMNQYVKGFRWSKPVRPTELRLPCPVPASVVTMPSNGVEPEVTLMTDRWIHSGGPWMLCADLEKGRVTDRWAIHNDLLRAYEPHLGRAEVRRVLLEELAKHELVAEKSKVAVDDRFLVSSPMTTEGIGKLVAVLMTAGDRLHDLHKAKHKAAW